MGSALYRRGRYDGRTKTRGTDDDYMASIVSWMPGHVHLLGAIRGAGLPTAASILYTDVWYEYDLTIYFGAGDGGWMNSKSNIRGEVTVARADQLQEVIMASVTR